jgi:hypothetical protein
MHQLYSFAKIVFFDGDLRRTKLVDVYQTSSRNIPTHAIKSFTE